MTMQDPLADMLTRIRNAQAVQKKEVTMPRSKLKLSVAAVLKNEGFILDCKETQDTKFPEMVIELKYHEEKPVITELKRVSKSGLRIYKPKDELPKVKSGLGIAIVSTSQGVMADREARRRGLGGEILCYVS